MRKWVIGSLCEWA